MPEVEVNLEPERLIEVLDIRRLNTKDYGKEV
jgi:hypothetical protein